jgi:lipopolysaccharide exporter
MPNLRIQALRGVKWTTFSNGAILILQLCQLAVLSRLLSPADYGLMAVTTVVVGFAQCYADMGVSFAIIHQQDVSQEKLSSLYWLNWLVGGLVFLVVAASAPLVAWFYGEPRLTALMLWAALAFLIAPLGQQFHVLLQKQLEFKALSLIEISTVVAGVAFSISAALAGMGVFALVWGGLTAVTMRTALLAILGFRRWRPSMRFQRADLKGFVSFGAYQMGERSINYLGGNLDKLFIGYLLNSQALGYYNMAYQLMLRPLQVLNPILTRVATPIFAKVQDDNGLIRRGYLEMIQIIALVSFPIYAAMLVLAEPLLGALLGDKWLPAVPVFQILTLLGFFYSLGNLLGTILIAKGRADLGFYLNVLMIFLYAAAIWLGAKWGIEGIAWGLVIATGGVLFPVGFFLRWRLVEMRPDEYVKAFVPILFDVSIVSVLVYFLNSKLSAAIGGGHWHRLAIFMACGMLIYSALLYLRHKPLLKRLWQHRISS